VSIRPRGRKELGTKTEIKNVNSFRFIREALVYEIARQIDVVAIYEIEHDKIAKAWFILGNPSFADPA